ncbi:HNH endonuclease signature motif containing protein [Robertmurraya kyonggiensis]|uniref:HNH endonuclease n=1 Tax=Robertmurraya kyonggiensis TaxID=1037680 RepID=A0A4U1DEF3_9BACI|nr:HNH endonuclease signature motif containing protein [Robertmurraya kyonggiensis]TKC19877.1 HNH endonuclease [Robertmurraya kyonggiensis]
MALTKNLLFQKYVIENQTISDIAKETGYPKNRVKSVLRRFGIRKTKMKLGNELYDDREWLYEQYVVLNKGYTVIADELGVSYTVVRDRILFFGWKIRGHKDIDKGSARRGKKHTESALKKIRLSRIKKSRELECLHCSRIFERQNSSILRSSKNFCTAVCFRQYLKTNRIETVDITDSAEYKEWRKKVYIRDGYRCKMPGCNSNSRDIAAHHIYPKKKFPNKKFDLQNGITLCRKCHEDTYGKEEQFIDALVRVIQKMND